MSKKTALVAFVAGALTAFLLEHTQVVIAGKKIAPGPDNETPKAQVQAVPRPGRPRPQMQAAAATQANRPKRYR
jgi:hypothetical protein